MFTAGKNLIVVAHKRGNMDKKDVISFYDIMVSKLNTNARQDNKIQTDRIKLRELSPSAKFFVALRNRTGPFRDRQSAVLHEYGVSGRQPVIYASELVIWDQEVADDLANHIFPHNAEIM